MFRYLITCLIILLLSFPVLAVEMSEKTLVTAWEKIQKDDPKTVTFEKIEDGLYKFHTKRFPYEGKLRILNSGIDEYTSFSFEEDNKSYRGYLEVDLEDMDPDLLTKIYTSYNAWLGSNSMYYDSNLKEWISSAEWNKRSDEYVRSYSGWSWMMLAGNWSWVGFIILMIWIFISSGRSVRKSLSAQDEALDGQKDAINDQKKAFKLQKEGLELAKENNKILKDILAELKK